DAAGSWPQIQQVIDLAARSQTRIYSIDPRGLGFPTDNTQTAGGVARQDPVAQAQSTGLGADDPFSGPGPAPTGQPTDGPNSLAADTGGFVIRHTNDFAGALQRIADDTRTYYLLGYHPTNTDFKGRFRRIEVKVRRPGVTVRARRGYLGVVRPQ
ncbi:MAG TPA: VWA domain-containing protein, partial [Vicinamibacterales bacterium]|nr:VWA domain-containing protein [Vicinamibacterales bacterium]